MVIEVAGGAPIKEASGERFWLELAMRTNSNTEARHICEKDVFRQAKLVRLTGSELFLFTCVICSNQSRF